MTHPDLAHRRPWLLASLLVGIGYVAVGRSALPELLIVAWKGSAVALLAIYALRRHHDGDFLWLGTALAICAIGDVAVEFDWIAGGLVFAIGHLAYMVLFLRNRRPSLSPSQRVLAIVLLATVPVCGYMLPAGGGRADVALYGLIVAGMAAAAWTSRFPRYRTGLGAMLFIASDVILFSRIGSVQPTGPVSWLTWPLYYAGQFLIATGTVGALRTNPRSRQSDTALA